MQGEKSQKSPLLINYTTARSKSQAKVSPTNKRKKRNKQPTSAQTPKTPQNSIQTQKTDGIKRN